MEDTIHHHHLGEEKELDYDAHGETPASSDDEDDDDDEDFYSNLDHRHGVTGNQGDFMSPEMECLLLQQPDAAQAPGFSSSRQKNQYRHHITHHNHNQRLVRRRLHHTLHRHLQAFGAGLKGKLGDIVGMLVRRGQRLAVVGNPRRHRRALALPLSPTIPVEAMQGTNNS